jgi:hypothetical protein
MKSRRITERGVFHLNESICNVPIKYDDRALADNESMALFAPQIEDDKDTHRKINPT